MRNNFFVLGSLYIYIYYICIKQKMGFDHYRANN